MKLLTQPHRILQAPLDQFTAMPIEIFDWSNSRIDDFHPLWRHQELLSCLMVLLSINGVAMVVRSVTGQSTCTMVSNS